MRVESGKRIKLEYDLSLPGGELIESSQHRGPIEYIHGTGKMLPGLERQIEGLAIGEELDGVIPPEEGYGAVEKIPTREIDLEQFPSEEPPEVGRRFEANDTAGAPVVFTVVSHDSDKVRVRFEHPLAGQALHFRVKVLDVSEPPAPPPVPG